MPAVSLNGVRVYDATVHVDWKTGAFVARGEIGRDPLTLARVARRGEACTIDGRPCRATVAFDLAHGQVTIRGEAFPWRPEEWAA